MSSETGGSDRDVHSPRDGSTADGGAERRRTDATGGSDAGDGTDAPAATIGAPEDAGEDAFGSRGWVLVGVVLVSLVLVPGAIYAYPAAPADAGLPFLVAMLVLPLVPAVLLGAAAVWSMTAAAGRDE